MNKEIAIDYLSKLKITILPNGCHISDRYHSRVDGYPKVIINDRQYRLSRIVLIANHDVDYYNKSIESRHTCNYPPCINPEHIIPGSASDNALDAVKAGTNYNIRKENCPKCGGIYHKRRRFYNGVVRYHRYCPRCLSRQRLTRRLNSK